MRASAPEFIPAAPPTPGAAPAPETAPRAHSAPRVAHAAGATAAGNAQLGTRAAAAVATTTRSASAPPSTGAAAAASAAAQHWARLNIGTAPRPATIPPPVAASITQLLASSTDKTEDIENTDPITGTAAAASGNINGRTVTVLTTEQVRTLRASQTEVSSTTRDGISIDALAEIFKDSCWDPKCPPLRVVAMGPDKCRPATLLDFTSALAPAGAAADAAARTILVSFDNRRLVAAKRALAKGADPKVHAIIVDQDEAAAREYATLRGLALSPRKPLSRAAARDLREAWNTWDDPELLADQGIRKGSWGHCIKIRMAMDLNPRRLAESTSGYAETPIVRAPSPESLTTHRKLAPQ